MRKTNRFFIILFPVLALLAYGILNISLRTFKNNETASGCGCDFGSEDGSFNENEKTAFYMSQQITAPLASLTETAVPPILGDISPGEKWIEVDLSEQKLIAWEGGNKFLETLVSSGKTGKTPTGEFNIWSKFKYAKMSGGSKENKTYYYLPNVPYTMYFYKGYGLHGTYWHNNFGHPMSHGCVNLPTLMAEKLFYWTTPVVAEGKSSATADSTNVGTRVVIHD